MQDNHNTNILGLKDFDVKYSEVDDKTINIYGDHIPNRICPYCHSDHNWVHDHRVQVIKDSPMRKKHVFLHVKKTRFDCQNCGKRFETPLSFAGKRRQMTTRLTEYVCECFSEIRSVTEIAKEIGISITTSFRMISCLSPSRRELPRVLCIDEFKGDCGNIKYQTTLADGENKRLVDILPTRFSKDLNKYFNEIDPAERSNVEIFVSDMCRTFKDVKENFFKKSIHVIDRYHYIRQVHWALENVRKREQKRMPRSKRLYFKRSKSLLKKPASKLTPEQMEQVSLMLEMNQEIKRAYQLKELFYEYVLTQPNKERASKALKEWIRRAKTYNQKEWRPCVRAYTNWFNEITNSFDYPWSNGFVEGCHNKIKVMKRVAYGYGRYDHFRSKILLGFS